MEAASECKAALIRRMEKHSLGRFCLHVFRIKMLRYFIVAGINTAFALCVYSSFLFIGLHYTLAALFGQILGILFNFKTYGGLVFKNNRLDLLPRFILVYVLTYFCNIGSMKLLKMAFGFNDYVAGAVMCIPIGLLGFVLNKIFVFERKPKKKKS